MVDDSTPGGIAPGGVGSGGKDQYQSHGAARAFREGRVDQEGAVELAATEFWTMNEELKGCSLADVLEKLEKGEIGHSAAMEWLNVTSYADLVEIMHANGRLMPGHQPMRVAPATRALLRLIFYHGAGERNPARMKLISRSRFETRHRP